MGESVLIHSGGISIDRPVAFLLPGQGSQHLGMAVDLYDREPVFTEVLDEFFELLGTDGKLVRDDWLSHEPDVSIDDASRAQPLLFAIDFALGRALRARGVRPMALLGHSVGELAAAALADVFELPGAAQVLAARSLALADTPAGGMLAVAATPEQVEFYLDHDGGPDGVVIGARNAPRQTVLAGPEPRLTAVERVLRDAGVLCRRVGARQPFHSPAVATAAARLAGVFAEVPLRAPTVSIWSTRTAQVVTPKQAVDPGFWAGQLAEPVLFWPALDNLLANGDFTLVECGPSQGLSVLARRHPSVRAGRSAVVPLLPRHAAGTWDAWLAALDRLAA
jgi:[acyl-carrier-protein] S-malonyltransferase